MSNAEGQDVDVTAEEQTKPTKTHSGIGSSWRGLRVSYFGRPAGPRARALNLNAESWGWSIILREVTGERVGVRSVVGEERGTDRPFFHDPSTTTANCKDFPIQIRRESTVQQSVSERWALSTFDNLFPARGVHDRRSPYHYLQITRQVPRM